MSRDMRGERGGALVELALVVPVLFGLAIGVADFARVFSTSIALTNAARAGAQYAAVNETQSKDTAGITSAARNAAPNIGTFEVLLSTPSATCWCAPNDGMSFTSTSC